MTISPAYPVILQNGTIADATEVMADFYQIQNDVNANAAENGVNTSITAILGLTTPLSISQGGTGATSAPAALAALGAAPVNSPTFTGDPKAPTPAPGDNDTSLATTAFVTAADAAVTAAYIAADAVVLASAATYTDTQTAAVVGQLPTVFSGTAAYSQPAAFSIAHGLGAVPEVFNIFLECTIAEAGYNPGDWLQFPAQTYSGGAGGTTQWCNTWADATSIGLGTNSYGFSTKAGTSAFSPSPSNWQFRATAVKFN